MKRVNKKIAAGIIVLSQVLSGAAFAASVTLAGSTVDFSFDDSMLGLFGQANVSGDTLYFTPTHFAAQSLNGAGYGLTNETINIKVSAHQDRAFSSFAFTEKGDYLLLGAGGSVNVTGQTRVFDVANPLFDITTSLQPAHPLTRVGLPSENWIAPTTTNLSAMISARAINVTVENLLLASTSLPNSLAFVEKKFVGLSLVTTPVPEAETYAMMLAGLGLVGFMAARRHADA